jgi:hypothetical protein
VPMRRWSVCDPMGRIFASIETRPLMAFDWRISSLPSGVVVHISTRFAFLFLISKEWEALKRLFPRKQEAFFLWVQKI